MTNLLDLLPECKGARHCFFRQLVEGGRPFHDRLYRLGDQRGPGHRDGHAFLDDSAMGPQGDSGQARGEHHEGHQRAHQERTGDTCGRLDGPAGTVAAQVVCGAATVDAAGRLVLALAADTVTALALSDACAR